MIKWIKSLFETKCCKVSKRKRLTDIDRMAIVESFKAGNSRKGIAEEFETSYGTVCRIVRGKK